MSASASLSFGSSEATLCEVGFGGMLDAMALAVVVVVVIDGDDNIVSCNGGGREVQIAWLGCRCRCCREKTAQDMATKKEKQGRRFCFVCSIRN